jgi:hypothetical protein
LQLFPSKSVWQKQKPGVKQNWCHRVLLTKITLMQSLRIAIIALWVLLIFYPAQWANAQEDFATLYFYRPKSGFMGLIRSAITVGDQDLGWIRNGTRLQYRIYQTGPTKIWVENYVEILGQPMTETNRAFVDLDIKPGDQYYLKLVYDVQGRMELRRMQAAIGEREYQKSSLFRYFDNEEVVEGPRDTENPQVQARKPSPTVDTAPQPHKPEKPAVVSDVDQHIPQTKMKNPDAIAIVIGNQFYSHPDVPDVDFAVEDARSIRNYLIRTLGYQEHNILYFENADQSTFFGMFGSKENHRARLFNLVKANQSDVFIYYSGHGAPDPHTREAYFVPTNCDPSLVEFNGYSLNTFYANLGKIPFRKLTVVLDACFSGASEAGMLIRDASPVYFKPKIQILHDERVAVFLSAAGNQLSSWHREQGHSLFTYYFLRGLQGSADLNQDKELTVGEMAEYLNQEVPVAARRLANRVQDPEIHGKPNKVLIRY